MPTTAKSNDVVTFLSDSGNMLLSYAACAYGMKKTRCIRSLFKFLGKDPLTTHPAIDPKEIVHIAVNVRVTDEELAALNAEAARLDRSRAAVLRLLLNHLTEFSLEDMKAGAQ